MASFMASPLVRRRHDEGKNGRKTQAETVHDGPVDTALCAAQRNPANTNRASRKQVSPQICRPSPHLAMQFRDTLAFGRSDKALKVVHRIPPVQLLLNSYSGAPESAKIIGPAAPAPP